MADISQAKLSPTQATATTIPLQPAIAAMVTQSVPCIVAGKSAVAHIMADRVLIREVVPLIPAVPAHPNDNTYLVKNLPVLQLALAQTQARLSQMQRQAAAQQAALQADVDRLTVAINTLAPMAQAAATAKPAVAAQPAQAAVKQA